jgi:hypothetical protein
MNAVDNLMAKDADTEIRSQARSFNFALEGNAMRENPSERSASEKTPGTASISRTM